MSEVNNPLSRIESGHAIVKINLTNTPVTAGVAILNPMSMFPVYKEASFYVFYVVFVATGRLTGIRSVDGVGDVDEILNQDIDLKAEAAYPFAIPVMENEIYNIKYSANTTARTIKVFETELR